MADDITLTVRVRDMTRGDFNQIRQRMRGMGGDIRRIARDADGATGSSDRFANSLTGLQRRLSQFQRTGNLARHEMDYMRRSMGLLGRDLRSAAADGELTEDQFRDLRRELERTRLDFDHLDNQLRRQDAMAQRRARNAAERQREAERLRREAMREAERQQREAARRAREERRRQEADARAVVALRRRMSQAHAAALRQEAQRNTAAARDELRRQQSRARQIVAQQQRISRAHAAALGEEAQRNRRAEAERDRAARAAAAAHRQSVGRLSGLGRDDQSMTLRFRALGEDDVRRMSRGFADLQRTVAGVSGSTAHARRNVNALSGDLRTMAQVLRDAQDSGSLSRREFNALSNGLRMAARDARLLRDSGDMTRTSFRDMRREVAGLRAQMRLLGEDGTRLTRLDDRMLLLQRRMREVRSGAGHVRRSVSRMGEGGVGGLRALARGLSHVTSGLGKFKDFVANSSRGVKMFLLVLGLIGPLAAPLGALLTTVLGGAFIALGAFALRSEKSVRTAFDGMKSTIGSTVREAAQPLRGPLILAMGQVADAAATLGPLLKAAFTATGPLVSDFAGALTGLLSSALPGFTLALASMGPVMEGFRDAMEAVGDGLGEMFAAMTADGGAEGLRRTWELIGKELNDLLVDVGEFISAMSQSAAATTLLTGMFEALSAILVVLEGAFAAIDTVLGPLLDLMHDLGLNLGLLGLLAKALESLGVNSGTAGTGIAGLEKNFSVVGKSSAKLKDQLAAVDKEIANIEKTEKALEKAGVAKRGGADPTAGLQAQRKGLLEAIKVAEAGAASETDRHATAVAKLAEQLKVLNNEMLGKLDARAAMESSIDDAIAKAEKFTGTVKIQNGVFDLTHEKSRDVYTSLSRIAKETANAAEQAVKAKAPLDEINGIWSHGREELMALAPMYNISKAEMQAFIDTVLQTPESVQTKLEVDKEQADAAVAETKKKLKDVDGTKAEATATVEHFRAMERLSMVESKLRALDGQTANTFVTNTIKTINKSETYRSVHDIVGEAAGGRLPRYARGDQVQFGPTGLLSGPGTGTSDDILAVFASGAMGAVSDTEFVVNAKQTKRHLPLLEAINAGRLPKFARGGKVSRNERDARNSARGDLTISHWGRKSGSKNTEFVNDMGLADSLKELVGTLNKWRGIIKKATHGGAEKRLLASLDKAGKSLLKYQAQHDKISKTLEKAKAVRDQVKAGVLSATDITRGVTGDKPVTVSSIMHTMTKGRDKATAFANALKELRKKGVSKDIIKQVADAGIEGGGLETAGALLRASGSEIKSINDMQDQIKKAASKAGNATADAMYGAGMKAGEGLIAGLEKQQKALEKAMIRIAKSMEKALKKALKIKSPSKVMEEVGDYTAEGFAVGIQKNSSTDRAWSSLLPSGSYGGGSRGGGGSTTVIKVYVGEKQIDEIVLDSNRRTVRTRGGNVQKIFSQR